MSNEPIEGEVLSSMPAPSQPTALVHSDNPYLNMAQMAMSQGKVSELRELLALQKEWDAEQQRKAFVSAMSDFKAEAGGITIAKSKDVKFKTSSGYTEYSHAELHDITRALVPVMAKYGLSHRWALSQEGGITVTCIVSHRAGHSESVSMTAPADDSGGKNKIQAIASTKSYLERYTFLAATGMATGGEIDDDGRSYGMKPEELEFITEEQEATLKDMIEACVNNKDAFLRWIGAQTGYEVTKLCEIQARHYDVVHAQLKRLEKERGHGTAG